MLQKAILSERVITPDGTRKAAVLIRDGIIEDILPELPSGKFDVTDLGSSVLMAGIIDPHVHINEPGRTHWEGFDTVSRSALAGGITTLVDMPLNASPVTTTVESFEKKLKATEGKLHVN